MIQGASLDSQKFGQIDVNMDDELLRRLMLSLAKAPHLPN